MIPIGVLAQDALRIPSAPVLSVDSTELIEYPIPYEPSDYTRIYHLSWTVPNNNGSTITGYKSEYSFNSGITWSLYTTHDALPTTFDVGRSSTQNGTEPPYLFRVSAINSVGVGTPSNSINIVYF